MIVNKLFLFLITFVFWSDSLDLKAQDERYEFVGALVTSSNYKITLKLNIVVDKDGIVSGKSITDYYGENSTESKIEGNLDLDSKLLSFHEVSNIKTKSNADASTFCYISVTDIPVTVEDEKNIISGDFKGTFPSGASCAEGKIYLVGADILEKLSSSESEAANATNVTENKPETLQELKRVINPSEQLKNGESIKVGWNTNKIKLSVWDSYFEDHDKINIYFNGELVHANVEVKERKKTFDLPFEGDTFTIKIEAVNEGLAPPNTVHASVVDGGSVWPFMTKLKKGESATIQIEKEKK